MNYYKRAGRRYFNLKNLYSWLLEEQWEIEEFNLVKTTGNYVTMTASLKRADSESHLNATFITDVKNELIR